MTDPIVNPGSIGPVAHRVVDGTTRHVALDLEPVVASLLPDIARAIVRDHLNGSLYTVGKFDPATDPTWATALGRITDALRDRGALTVQLHPDAAERLSGELWDAKDEPDTCTWGEGECQSYVDGGDFCPLHNEKAADVSARLRSAR